MYKISIEKTVTEDVSKIEYGCSDSLKVCFESEEGIYILDGMRCTEAILMISSALQYDIPKALKAELERIGILCMRDSEGIVRIC